MMYSRGLEIQLIRGLRSTIMTEKPCMLFYFDATLHGMRIVSVTKLSDKRIYLNFAVLAIVLLEGMKKLKPTRLPI